MARRRSSPRRHGLARRTRRSITGTSAPVWRRAASADCSASRTCCRSSASAAVLPCSATSSTRPGQRTIPTRLRASSRSPARPRTSSPGRTANGSGSRRSSARAIRPRSRSTATVIARASRGARSRRRRPMPPCSTACWRRSAVASSSAPQANSLPARSTAASGENEAVALKLASLAFFVLAWFLGSLFAGEQMLPSPLTVAAAIVVEARSGALFFHVGVTLARVFLAFALSMCLGAALGLLMGRVKTADRLGDPWLVVLLNLPALVIIVLAYIWGGLTETAAILAVAVNKLPNTIVTVREGARALDPTLDEMAQVFAMPRWKTLRHVIVPQLGPYLAAAARSGLSLVWKIVLVVELLGRPNGVGFEIGIAFQLFDVTRILAYALAFIVVILVIETFLVQPLERHVTRWRPRTA